MSVARVLFHGQAAYSRHSSHELGSAVTLASSRKKPTSQTSQAVLPFALDVRCRQRVQSDRPGSAV